MVRAEVWEKLKSRGRASCKLKPGLRLRSLSGHLIPSSGVAEIIIAGVMCDFYVVPELQHDLLIGTDVMEKCRAVISYDETSVTLNGREHRWIGRGVAYANVSGVVTEGDYWKERFPGVFPPIDAPLVAANVVEMKIDTGNARPINQRAYRMPLCKMKQVEEEIQTMLREDIIEPSCSPWASPVTLVPKKDGSVRICGDYRRLNEVTLKDAYPLPRIQDIFDQLSGAKVFTTIDLKSGYWQVRMSPDSKEKTAISTHRGLFQFKRMQFGLTNAPAVFQRMMNSVLAKYLGVSCLIYLDDVVIYSRNEETHRVHVEEVLAELEKHGLAVKESKCSFGLSEVKLLGFVVCAEGLKADPDKVAAIRDMAPPTDKKGVRRVLGSANYYHQLMVHYADVVAPLTNLTRKTVKFDWDEKCQEAWRKLKQLLLDCVVLKFPNPAKPYKLYTDASDYSLGAILVQADDNGVERPVHLISGRFSKAQLNYPTIEKEAYAVIYALIKLRPYLYGANFVIYTDHQPLKCLFTKEMKNSRIQRWSVLLSEFAAPIQYMRGCDNVWADMLSRLRPEKEAIEPEQMSTVLVAALEEEIPWVYYELDGTSISKLHAATPEYEDAEKGEKGFLLIDGVIYTMVPPSGKREYPRLWLPVGYRERVIKIAHKDVGHMAVAKTLQRVQEHFRWPGMAMDVVKFITKCGACAINKVKRDFPLPTEMPLPAAPGLIIAADLTGPFPESAEGNKYLLSIIDHCTGWVEVKPLPDKSAKSIYNYLVREYFPRYSAPEVFLTDNGLEFKNKLIIDHLEELGVEVRHSTPYHPQSNGMVERFHRTMKDMLKKMVNSRAGQWEHFLGDVLTAYRTTCSGSTGFTPFYLTYGRHPNRPHGNLLHRDLDDVKTSAGRRVDALAEALQEAVCNRKVSRQYNILRAVNRANAPNLKIGDAVLLRVNEPGPLDRRYDPGFIVTKVWGSVITCVGPDNVKRTVNRDQVKLTDPEVQWDEIKPRLTRAQRRREKQRVARARQARAGQKLNTLGQVPEEQDPTELGGGGYLGLPRGLPRELPRELPKGLSGAQYTGEQVNPGENVDTQVGQENAPATMSVDPTRGTKRVATGGADSRLELAQRENKRNPAASPKRGFKRHVDAMPVNLIDSNANSTSITEYPRQVATQEREERLTVTGASKRAALPLSPPSTRVLRSHTREGGAVKTRLLAEHTPSEALQKESKRACIAAVIACVYGQGEQSALLYQHYCEHLHSNNRVWRRPVRVHRR